MSKAFDLDPCACLREHIYTHFIVRCAPKSLCCILFVSLSGGLDMEERDLAKVLTVYGVMLMCYSGYGYPIMQRVRVLFSMLIVVRWFAVTLSW